MWSAVIVLLGACRVDPATTVAGDLESVPGQPPASTTTSSVVPVRSSR
ncbi:MAG: hypothetical protein ACI9ME_001749, partial [Ilumatobacter sp.]